MKEDNEALPLTRNEICFLIATVSTRVIAHKAFEHILLSSVQHQMIHCIFVPFDRLQVIDANNIHLLASQIMASYYGWAKHGMLISQLCGCRKLVPFVRSIAIDKFAYLRDLARALKRVCGRSENSLVLHQTF